MNKVLRKRIKILIERIKVPRRLLSAILHVLGLYRRGFRNAHDIRLNKLTVELKRLPTAFDGYRILILSDLHIDSELHLVPRIKKILSSTPADALFFLGDYRFRLDGADDLVLKRIDKIRREINVADGIFAVRGNHDSKEILTKMGDMGMQVLNNQSASVQRDGRSLFFVGVDEPHYDKADDLPAALRVVPQDACTILLAHTAEIYRQAEEQDIDLYLCGHTHGGQVCIKGIGPIITNVKAPRRFAKGFWSYEKMQGYTSSGVGASAVPIRFNCPPEIVLLTLRNRDVDTN